MRTHLGKNQRGAALLETAITLPLILLISVAIFEFGRAYQTWQVLTNAAREGARIAVLTGKTDDEVRATVRSYMSSGQLPHAATADVGVDRGLAMGTSTASEITVRYPFAFMVLNPVVRLVSPHSETGKPLTMQAVAVMRNES